MKFWSAIFLATFAIILMGNKCDEEKPTVPATPAVEDAGTTKVEEAKPEEVGPVTAEDVKVEAKEEKKPEAKPEKEDKKPEAKPEVKPAPKAEPKAETKPAPKATEK